MNIQTHDNALSGYTTGQFLLAMPHIKDPHLERAIVYVCGHDASGAMGLMINKPFSNLTLKDLLDSLNLPRPHATQDIPIHFGGPQDRGRGFIIHSEDVVHPTTVSLGNTLALTATVDALQSIAAGSGPAQSLLVMGYVGWEEGQLDKELHSAKWLQMQADQDILFHIPIEQKWEAAIETFGIGPECLSEEYGQA